jgi:hypothetical protein
MQAAIGVAAAQGPCIGVHKPRPLHSLLCFLGQGVRAVHPHLLGAISNRRPRRTGRQRPERAHPVDIHPLHLRHRLHIPPRLVFAGARRAAAPHRAPICTLRPRLASIAIPPGQPFRLCPWLSKSVCDAVAIKRDGATCGDGDGNSARGGQELGHRCVEFDRKSWGLRWTRAVRVA